MVEARFSGDGCQEVVNKIFIVLCLHTQLLLCTLNCLYSSSQASAHLILSSILLGGMREQLCGATTTVQTFGVLLLCNKTAFLNLICFFFTFKLLQNHYVLVCQPVSVDCIICSKILCMALLKRCVWIVLHCLMATSHSSILIITSKVFMLFRNFLAVFMCLSRDH